MSGDNILSMVATPHLVSAWGTVPQWGSLLTLLGIFITLVTVAIKVLPDYLRARNEGKKLTIDERAAIRTEDRDEVAVLREDQRVMDEKINKALESCRVLKIQVAQLHFALRLATQEIETGIPDSKVPGQIASLLAASFPTSDPSGVAQSDMDILRGRA